MNKYKYYQLPERTGYRTHLDIWMLGKWVVEGGSEIIVWFTKEHHARAFCEMMNENN